MSFSLIDRELLDALEASKFEALNSDIWRVAWRSQDVLRGGLKGRWNPKSASAPALYTSLEMDGAVAEVYTLLSKQPVFSSADKLLYRLKARTQRTLILDDNSELQNLGIDLFGSANANLNECQLLAEAAYRLDFDSLLVPSARWNCSNLVLFTDLIDPNDIWIDGDPMEINWPAWADKNAEYSRIYRRRMHR